MTLISGATWAHSWWVLDQGLGCNSARTLWAASLRCFTSRAPALQMMRGTALAACALLFGGLLRGTLGDVVVNWLSTTWISTGRRGGREGSAMASPGCLS